MMKKIKLIFILLVTTLLVMSCTKDDSPSRTNLTNGAAPNINKIATTDGLIDLNSLVPGKDLNLGFTVDIARGDVASADIVLYYKPKGGTTFKGSIPFKKGVTTFPSTYTIKKQDIIDVFTLINVESDIKLGDQLTITTDITLKNGTIIKMFNDDGTANYGSDIANSLQFNTFQSYDVACALPSATLYSGRYEVTADDWADYSIGDNLTAVYVPADGTFTFRIPNVDRPFIVNSATSYLIVKVNPADGSVKVSSNEVWDYGPGSGNKFTVTGGGKVDTCTGDIFLKLNFVSTAGQLLNAPFYLKKL